MNGLGNDFAVFDCRKKPIALDPEQAKLICDRGQGIGCDQLIMLEKPKNTSDVFMRIFNADGIEVEACGNAARCIGRFIMDEKNTNTAIIDTKGGLLKAQRVPNGITVDMGPAYLEWQDIPLSKPMTTISLDIIEGPVKNPVAVGMGNPHVIFFVDNLNKINISEIGPVIEVHRYFPNRTNVGFAQVLSRESIRLKVWERGVGITEACGTGACAALVAAARRNLTDNKATIEVDGGTLAIEWLPNNHVLMTGQTEIDYSGSYKIA